MSDIPSFPYQLLWEERQFASIANLTRQDGFDFLSLAWRTLDEVDAVAPVSVDDRHNPKFVKVHIIDGGAMRDRFNRAYAARKKTGHSIPIRRAVWVSLKTV